MNVIGGLSSPAFLNISVMIPIKYRPNYTL